MNRIRIITFVFILQLSAGRLSSQTIHEDGKEFPIPSGNAKQLFYLQRTENINTVIYELNEPNGVLDIKDPIHVFWILYAKNDQREELSEVEKKMAYGIKKTELIKNDDYEITLAAYSKIKLRLTKSADKKYKVYVTPGKQEMILQRLYLKVKQGGFKIEPKVEYILFSGISVATGELITEKIVP